MNKQLTLIPRWAGRPTSDWYPWLKNQLEIMNSRPYNPITVADMPNPDLPIISEWVEKVKHLLENGFDGSAQSVIVAHSVGCQAVLRALADLPKNNKIEGALFIAGWFWTDAPWESLIPWIETPIDLEHARSLLNKRIIVLISDNDQHTSDWQKNRNAWQERMNAEVILVPGANHFNGERYPVILQTLLENFT